MYMGYASHVGSGNDVDMSAVELMSSISAVVTGSISSNVKDVDMSAVELMSSISVAVPGSISSDVKDAARSVHDKISKCILNQ